MTPIRYKSSEGWNSGLLNPAEGCRGQDLPLELFLTAGRGT